LGAYSGVAVPDIHIDVGQRVASVGVDHLDVHVERDTFLGLDDVLADHLTSNICIC
jgi:hypothetical protein